MPPKKSPPKPPAKQKVEVVYSEAPESESCIAVNLYLCARIMSLFAMCVLIADVVLSHRHSVLFATIAGGLLTSAAGFNLLSTLCNYDGDPYSRAAKAAMKADLIALVNIICLDAFLYEEQSYNRWGHAENVLKQERTVGALLEVLIAMWIFWHVSRAIKKDESDAMMV